MAWRDLYVKQFYAVYRFMVFILWTWSMLHKNIFSKKSKKARIYSFLCLRDMLQHPPSSTLWKQLFPIELHEARPPFLSTRRRTDERAFQLQSFPRVSNYRFFNVVSANKVDKCNSNSFVLCCFIAVLFKDYKYKNIYIANLAIIPSGRVTESDLIRAETLGGRLSIGVYCTKTDHHCDGEGRGQPPHYLS